MEPRIGQTGHRQFRHGDDHRRNAAFIAPGARFATFDQDGTLWVEQPMYTQLVFALDRVRVLAPEHPAWKTTEPFKSVIAGDCAAITKFTMKDLEEILLATHTGMTTASSPRS